jgi:CheY-like chemotaxis protein
VNVILLAGIVKTLPEASFEPALEEFKVAAKKPLRIALVDDHELVRQGLRRLLEDHQDICVIGEAKDGLEAIAMAQELKPDIIIMDVNMPRMNGIEATRQIVLDQPGVIVIGLSMSGATKSSSWREDQKRLAVEEGQFLLQPVTGLFHLAFNELCRGVVAQQTFQPGAPVVVDDGNAAGGL